MFNALKSNHRKIIITVIAGLLLIGAGIWLWLGRVDAKIINPNVTITRVTLGSEKTENAYFSLSYTADSNKYHYINIAVDFNQDGKFASYQSNGKTQEEWVVKNIDTFVFMKEGGNYDFKLVDFNLDNQKNFPAQIILTKKSLDRWQGEKMAGSGYQTAVILSVGIDDISPRFMLVPEGKTGVAFAQNENLPNIPPEDNQTDIDKTGDAPAGNQDKPKEKTIQTLAKEFEVFVGDVPDIVQGKNECAPTSVANSLLWLAKKNNFSDKMPQSQAGLLDELKGDLKWKVDNGVADENFIPGKEAFAKRHNLPLEIHRVNAKDYDLNIVAKIAQELQKGQDVEIGIEYWRKQADGKWKVVGGHWVTAVGATGTKDSQTIFVHDPLSPGPSLLDIYKVDGTKIIDYRYQGDTVAYIQYAVAESPILVPVVTPSDSSSPSNPDATTTSGAKPTSPTATSGGKETSTADSPSADNPTPTPTPSSETTPILTSWFEHYTDYAEQGYPSVVGVYIKPTDTAGRSITSCRFNLTDIFSDPSSVTYYDLNVNQSGDAQGWTCTPEMGSFYYNCSGPTALLANMKTIGWFYSIMALTWQIIPPTMPFGCTYNEGSVEANSEKR